MNQVFKHSAKVMRARELLLSPLFGFRFRSGILVPLYGIPPYVYYYCGGKSGTFLVSLCRIGYVHTSSLFVGTHVEDLSLVSTIMS
jgi:hypothetical protein